MTIVDAVRFEIAATGTIRAAVNMSNAALIRWDENTGALVGPSVEIAKRIGQELDRELSFIRYESAANILSAADAGEWDIGFIASDASRTDRFSFSPPYASVDATYLVPQALAIQRADEVDTEGIRIASARSAAYTRQLERNLKKASVLHVDSPSAALDVLARQECDAAAGLGQFLHNAADRMKGFKVLDGAFSRIPQSVAVKKHAISASAFLADLIGRLHEAAPGEEEAALN
ncbi:transporter substrate-binding domain-containing protein [Oryzifoliimicrobium ureilyticus]|uniref:transporter substrate-binding domain-containing protein n=1 Tax=Oryzifoliimicrobium ureilyticus TaxID=3113724 RepID=UPI0030762FEE